MDSTDTRISPPRPLPPPLLANPTPSKHAPAPGPRSLRASAWATAASPAWPWCCRTVPSATPPQSCTWQSRAAPRATTPRTAHGTAVRRGRDQGDTTHTPHRLQHVTSRSQRRARTGQKSVGAVPSLAGTQNAPVRHPIPTPHRQHHTFNSEIKTRGRERSGGANQYARSFFAGNSSASRCSYPKSVNIRAADWMPRPGTCQEGEEARGMSSCLTVT